METLNGCSHSFPLSKITVPLHSHLILSERIEASELAWYGSESDTIVSSNHVKKAHQRY
jgi:hypothetical protein